MHRTTAVALAIALCLLAAPARAETMTVAQSRCDETTCTTTYSEYLWNPFTRQWTLVSVTTVTIQRTTKAE